MRNILYIALLSVALTGYFPAFAESNKVATKPVLKIYDCHAETIDYKPPQTYGPVYIPAYRYEDALQVCVKKVENDTGIGLDNGI